MRRGEARGISCNLRRGAWPQWRTVLTTILSSGREGRDGDRSNLLRNLKILEKSMIIASGEVQQSAIEIAYKVVHRSRETGGWALRCRRSDRTDEQVHILSILWACHLATRLGKERTIICLCSDLRLPPARPLPRDWRFPRGDMYRIGAIYTILGMSFGQSNKFSNICNWTSGYCSRKSRECCPRTAAMRLSALKSAAFW